MYIELGTRADINVLQEVFAGFGLLFSRILNPARPNVEYVTIAVGGSKHNGELWPSRAVNIINEIGYPEPGWTPDRIAQYKKDVYARIFPQTTSV